MTKKKEEVVTPEVEAATPAPKPVSVPTEELSTEPTPVVEEVDVIKPETMETEEAPEVAELNTEPTLEESAVDEIPDDFNPELKADSSENPGNFKVTLTGNEREYYEGIIRRQKNTIATLRSECFKGIKELKALKNPSDEN